MTADEVEAALVPIRKQIRADGGDIELLQVEGGDATVRLTGVCASCPMSSMTLYLGVETVLRQRIQGFETLHVAS